VFHSGRTVQNNREIRVVGLGLVLVWQALAAGFGLYIPLAGLLFAPWPKLGVVVFAAGLALIAIAIADMGPSWQIGFDQTVPEHGLVRTRVFGLSRNPIYLGLGVLFIGWLLLLPTLLSLIIVVGVRWASDVRLSTRRSISNGSMILNFAPGLEKSVASFRCSDVCDNSPTHSPNLGRFRKICLHAYGKADTSGRPAPPQTTFLVAVCVD
jgi:hypothetical protein